MSATPTYHPYDGSEKVARPAVGVPFDAWLLTGVAAVFLLVGSYVIATRGPWLDEFWSLWQSQHDIPLGDIVSRRWMSDFNPPLFSLLHWLSFPIVGDSIVTHRFVNLLGLFWAAAFVVVALRRFPQRAGFLVVFAALVVSLPSTMHYVAEMRSYFLQMCVHFVLVAFSVLVLDPREGAGSDLDWHTDKVFALFAFVSIAAAINLHYISGFLTCVLLAGLTTACFVRGWYLWAVTIGGVTIASCAPLLWYLVVQSQFLMDSAKEYWLHESTLQAASTLFFTALNAIRSNLLAVLVAAVASVVTVGSLRPAFRSFLDSKAAAIFDPEVQGQMLLSAPRRQAALTLLSVLAIFGLVMLLINSRQSIVSERYLLNFQIVAVGIVACLASQALALRRTLLVIFVVSAVLTVGLNGRRVAREHRWDTTAREVAAQVNACRESAVYSHIVMRPSFSKNEVSVQRWAAQRQAARFGFQMLPLDSDSHALPPATGACPSLLWVEHLDWTSLRQNPTPQEALRFVGIDDVGIDLARSRVFSSESGMVLTLPAKAR